MIKPHPDPIGLLEPARPGAMAVTFLHQFPAQDHSHIAELTTQYVLQPGYD